MARLVPSDLEIYGFTLLALGAPPETLTGLLDRVDRSYMAVMEGRAAGHHGQLAGENPYCCHGLRADWQRGWERGNAALMANGVVAVIIH